MEPFRHFAFCPRCGAARAGEPRAPFRCPSCGFLFHFNPATGTGAIALRPDGRALFIRRADEPARGKLAVPGGFVDHGERAEDALRREFREEVNLEPDRLEYLCSSPNSYSYEGVTYAVLDLFFVARLPSVEGLEALDGVASFAWIRPADVDPDEVAFPSIREALRTFLARS